MSHAKTMDLVSTLEMLTSVPVLQHSQDQIVKVNIWMYIYIHLIDENGAGWCLECLICYPRTPFKNDFFSSFSVKLLCSDNPCNNNGTCIDDFGNYTCVCLPGFTGDQCQGKILINLLVLINITAVYLTLIPRARMGYWLRGHEGERNNCFSKIQLVGKKYREK